VALGRTFPRDAEPASTGEPVAAPPATPEMLRLRTRPLTSSGEGSLAGGGGAGISRVRSPRVVIPDGARRADPGSMNSASRDVVANQQGSVFMGPDLGLTAEPG
jgi:hypothetical protein